VLFINLAIIWKEVKSVINNNIRLARPKYTCMLQALFLNIENTVCPGRSDPFYIVTYYYKMGQYFLDIQYIPNACDNISSSFFMLTHYTAVILLLGVQGVMSQFLSRLKKLLNRATSLYTAVAWLISCLLYSEIYWDRTSGTPNIT